MKQITLLFLSALLTASVCSAQRLPENVVPESYQLLLNPDLDKATFAGDESIRIRILRPTSQIVLNAAEVTFESATVSGGRNNTTCKNYFRKR